jgi:hypothetical protein
MPKSSAVLKLNRSQVAAKADLIVRIKEAQIALGRKIQQAAAAGNLGSAKFREAFFGKVAGHYEALGAEIDDWGKALVDKTAREWHKAAILDVQKYGDKVGAQVLKFSPDRVKRYWQYVNPDNAQHLAGTFTNKMSANDVQALRSAVVDMERQRTLEGWTQNEFQKKLQDRWDELAGNLVESRFTDAAGRPWSNAAYLSMISRTITARVARDSYFDTLVENGDDLAMIGPSGDSCPICRAWNGLIISISGGNPKYPSYQNALDAGVFHPNCDCLIERMDETVHKEDIKAQGDAPNPDWKDPDAVQKYKDDLKKKQDAVKKPETVAAKKTENPAAKPVAVSVPDDIVARASAIGTTKTEVAGMIVEQFGPVAPVFRQKVEAALAKIPAKAAEVIKKTNRKILISEKLLDIRPDLKGVLPRNWPKGTSWANAEGLCDADGNFLVSRTKREMFGKKMIETERAGYVVHHEAGHCFDKSIALRDYTVRPSKSSEFLQAYRLDQAEITDTIEREKLHYFLASGDAGPQETFAELFATECGTSSKLYGRFPRCREVMKKLIE